MKYSTSIIFYSEIKAFVYISAYSEMDVKVKKTT